MLGRQNLPTLPDLNWCPDSGMRLSPKEESYSKKIKLTESIILTESTYISMLDDPEIGDWLFEVLYKKLETVRELCDIWWRWEEGGAQDPAVIQLKQRIEREIRERVRAKYLERFNRIKNDRCLLQSSQ